jgi:putative membrane protein
MSEQPPEGAQRLHFAAAVQGALGQLKQMAFLIALLVWRGSGSQESYVELAVLAVLIPALLARGVVRWVRFRYWLTDSGVEAIDGAFVRKRVSIPFDRVRAIEENEGVVHQLFDVTRLQIKTGATGTQLDLSALDRATAAQLTIRLRERAALEQRQRGASSSDRVPGARARTLGVADLLKVGVTTRGAGTSALVTTWVFDAVAGWFGVESGPLLLVVALAVFTALSGVFGVGATVLKFWGFQLTRVGDQLDVRHGLFTRQTIQLDVTRVQAIRLRQTLLQSLFGTYGVLVEVVGHSEEKGQSSELLPWLPAAKLDAFLAEMLPGFSGDVPVERPPARALGRFVFAPTLATLLLSSALAWWTYDAVGPAAPALAALVTALVALSRVMAHRQTGAGVNAHLMRVERRHLFSREITLLPRRAVRSSSSRADPIQRLRRLATLGVVVASGARGRTFRAPNLDRGDADGLMGWATAPR